MESRSSVPPWDIRACQTRGCRAGGQRNSAELLDGSGHTTAERLHSPSGILDVSRSRFELTRDRLCRRPVHGCHLGSPAGRRHLGVSDLWCWAAALGYAFHPGLGHPNAQRRHAYRARKPMDLSVPLLRGHCRGYIVTRVGGMMANIRVHLAGIVSQFKEINNG